jgi:hypothetical protein
MGLQDELNYHADLYADTIENFDRLYQSGQIGDEDYLAMKANAFEEYQERIADASDVDAEDFEILDDMLGVDDYDYEDDYAYYSDGYDDDYVAEFSVGNDFGVALLELGEAAGYEDLEDYAEDLAEATGNNFEDILDLITGEAVPDDELALGISDIFGLDDDLAADLLIAGADARGEDLEDYFDFDDEDDYYDDDDEDYSDYEDEETAEASYRLAEIEEELAEFKYTSTIKDALDTLMLEAADLVDEGMMPPSTFDILFSSFDLDSDRIAAFSATCNANDVDPATELYALEKIVDIFRRMPPTVDFGYMVEEEFISDEEAAIEDEIDAIAHNFVHSYRTE